MGQPDHSTNSGGAAGAAPSLPGTGAPTPAGASGTPITKARCTALEQDEREYQICEGSVTWQQAVEQCAAKPGFALASVDDRRENDLFASKAGGWVWLGASDATQEGSWTWSDSGTRLARAGTKDAGYTNWAPSEPTADGDCLSISDSGTWTARDCSATASLFICKAVTLRWSAPGGGELKELAPPLSNEASRALVTNFRWGAARPVAETDPDGNPALRYVKVYIKSRAERETLRRLSVGYRFKPLLGAERRALWEGQVGYHAAAGDGTGAFAFAVLPARVYNLLIGRAQSGQTAFDAVLDHDPKIPEALHPDGSLSYAYLVKNGFRYDAKAAAAARRPSAPTPGDSGSNPTGQLAAPTGDASEPTVEQSIFDDIVELGAEVVEAVGGAIEDGVGAIDQAFSGTRRFTIEVRLADVGQNDSMTFMIPNVAGRRPLLSRTWGQDIGDPLTLPNTTVEAENVLIGQHSEDTNGEGIAELAVADGRDYELCLLLDNPSAEVASNFFTTEIELCDYTGRIISQSTPGAVVESNDLDEDQLGSFRTFTLVVEHRYAQVLALVTDADRYLSDVANINNDTKAQILVGGIANTINNEGGAFTPCFDFPNWVSAPILDFAGQFLVGGVSAVLGSPIRNSDIVLNDEVTRDRGVVVHEWGHFVTCEILYDESAVGFGTTWTMVMTQSLAQDTDTQVSMMAESFADFFASQVVGGTNYFGAAPTTGRDFGGLFYCNPLNTSCIDDNFGGPARSPARPFGQLATDDDIDSRPFHRGVGRFASLLVDVVDGQQTFPASNDPTNGGVWEQNASGFTGGLISQQFSLNDEAIELPGTRIHDIFQFWFDQSGYNDFSIRNVSLALVDLLLDEGYTDEQICQLFALHEKSGQCPNWLPVAQNVVPHAPFPLTGVTDATGRGVWTWQDDSPFATHFEWELHDLTTGDTIVQSGTTPHGPSPTSASFTSLNPLNPNSFYRFEVLTANNALKSPEAWNAFYTPAEPVSMAACVVDREEVSIDWDSVRADRYQVEYRQVGSSGWETAATTSASDKRVQGLDGGSSFEFRVTSLNLIGQPSAPSPVVTCQPDLLKRIYVSAATGDDSAADPGTTTSPFRTIAAALDWADNLNALNVDNGGWGLLTLAAGEYSYPEIFMPRGALTRVRVSGGYSAGSWTQDGGPTTIRLTTVAATGKPFSGSSESAAGIIIAEDRYAKFDNLQIVADAAPDGTRCTVAIMAENLVLQNASVTTAGNLATTRCRGAIHAHSDTGNGVVSIRKGSRVSGVDLAGGALTTLSSTGVASSSPGAELVVSDSLVSAASNPGSTAPSGAFVVGVAASGATTTIARSTVWSMNQSPDWSFSEGVQLAVYGSGRRTVVHNSVLRSAAGGSASYALATAADKAEVDVVQSTLVVGDDWNGGTGRARGFRGASYALGSSPVRVYLRNNLFSYAGGGTPSFDTILSTLDFSGLLASVQGPDAIRVMSSVGNVFSIGSGLGGNTWATLFCFNFEFGYYTEETSMNRGHNYACNASSYASSYDARENQVLTEPAFVPPPCTTDAQCSRPYTCTLPAGQCQFQQAPVAELETTGRPVNVPSSARETLRTTAQPLELPDASTYAVDLTGVQRSAANVQHVGAFVIP